MKWVYYVLAHAIPKPYPRPDWDKRIRFLDILKGNASYPRVDSYFRMLERVQKATRIQPKGYDSKSARNAVVRAVLSLGDSMFTSNTILEIVQRTDAQIKWSRPRIGGHLNAEFTYLDLMKVNGNSNRGKWICRRNGVSVAKLSESS